MSRLRWTVRAVKVTIGMAAATSLASISGPVAARADGPVTPDPNILDVLDSVLAENGGPGAVPSAPAPQPMSPHPGPAVPVRPG